MGLCNLLLLEIGNSPGWKNSNSILHFLLRIKWTNDFYSAIFLHLFLLYNLHVFSQFLQPMEYTPPIPIDDVSVVHIPLVLTAWFFCKPPISIIISFIINHNQWRVFILTCWKCGYDSKYWIYPTLLSPRTFMSQTNDSLLIFYHLILSFVSAYNLLRQHIDLDRFCYKPYWIDAFLCHYQ